MRTLLPLAMVLASTGCGMLPSPATNPSPTSEQPPRSATGDRGDDADLRYYPDATSLVEEAEAASGRGDHGDAMKLADQARETLSRTIAARRDPRSDEVQSRQRISLRICLVKVLAYRSDGRDLDALIEVIRRTHSVIYASGDRQAVWEEQIMALREQFPRILYGRGSDVQVKTVGLVRTGLNELLIDVVKRSVGEGWHAVEVETTSLLGEEDTIALRVEGETRKGTYDDCVKLGKAYAGGTEYLLKRCQKKGYVAPRADFVVHVPRADVRRLSIKKRQRVTVLFQGENWRREGRVRDAGLGRIAIVQTLP